MNIMYNTCMYDIEESGDPAIIAYLFVHNVHLVFNRQKKCLVYNVHKMIYAAKKNLEFKYMYINVWRLNLWRDDAIWYTGDDTISPFFQLNGKEFNQGVEPEILRIELPAPTTGRHNSLRQSLLAISGCLPYKNLNRIYIS